MGVCTFARAQADPVPPPEVGSPWAFTLTAGYGHDDNLSLLPVAPVGGHYLLLYPALSATWGGDRRSTTLHARAEWLRHAGRPQFDRTNSEWGAAGVSAVGLRGATAWRIVLQDWHDPVGTGALTRPDDEPDHFVAGAAGIVGRLDAADGPGRVEAEVNMSRKKYQNHRAVTVAGDLATRGWVVRSVRRAPAGDVQWSVEARALAADYDFQPLALSHDDQRLQFGAQVDPIPGAQVPWSWRLLVGWQRLGFDRFRPTHRGLTWEAGGQWLPRQGSVMDVSGRRQAGVLAGDLADTVTEQSFRLAWTEWFGEGWTATAAVAQTWLHYRYGGFADGQARDERVRQVDVELRRRLDEQRALVATMSTLRRAADDPDLAYRRRVLRVMIEAQW